jgi:hypothetical protein
MAKVQIQKWLSPSVPFILKVDGPNGASKEFSFQLCLDFNALGMVEKYTGIPLTNPSLIFRQLTVNNIQVLLWAAVQAYHPEYAGDAGLEVIGSLLNFRNSGSAVDATWEAFLLAVPEETAARLRAAVKDAQESLEAGEQPETDPTKTAPASK